MDPLNPMITKVLSEESRAALTLLAQDAEAHLNGVFADPQYTKGYYAGRLSILRLFLMVSAVAPEVSPAIQCHGAGGCDCPRCEPY